jgi:hypothetical protein
VQGDDDTTRYNHYRDQQQQQQQQATTAQVQLHNCNVPEMPKHTQLPGYQQHSF